MTQTFAERVRMRMDELQRNQYEVARLAGLDRNFVRDILSGRKASVRGANLEKLAKGLDWSVSEILGDAHAVATSRAVDVLPRGALSVPLAAGYVGAGSLGEIMEIDRFDPASGESVTTDAVDGWWELPGPVVSKLTFSRNPHLVCFPTGGDSMEPTILRTDFVFIDLSRRQIEPEGIFAVDYGIGRTLKRIRMIKNGDEAELILKSDNAAYDDYRVSPEELTIIGRYVGRFTVY